MLSDTLHAIHPYTTQPMMTQDASAAAAGATQADDSTWAIIGGIMAAVMQHLAIKVRANCGSLFFVSTELHVVPARACNQMRIET